MSGSWIFNSAMSALLLLPFSLVLWCAFGLWLRGRWLRFGTGVSLMALLLLTVFSTRPGAMLLVAPLEKMNPPLSAAQAAGAQAIVVLGAGRIANAPEYDGRDVPSAIGLQRLRYAAKLHRDTGLPILLSGGMPDGSTVSEAAIMERVLREDFVVPTRWLEERSNNTAENARDAAAMLRKSGIQRILLVTDAIHMQRARLAFQRTGLTVIAAPTVFDSAERVTIVDWFPRSRWLQRSDYASHEWLGLAWYWLKQHRAAP
ncbi:MAG TPA: YdcF family protein [Oxalicibacterium sp.]|nr:YdcF family protein [Oxalicibacterium sp.]